MRITDTQRAMLALIAERIEAEGMPPSQTELARAMGFSSVRAAQYHLDALAQAGAIERVPGRARGLRLTEAGLAELGVDESPASHGNDAPASAVASGEALHLPVLGQVAAGQPIGADIGLERMVLLDRALFMPSPDYLLQVKGDSMRDEGILDGDLIGVHRTRDARSGQIVVARIDDEITVKLLKIGKDRIRLLPRNPDHAPIEVLPGQDFAIEGLYCGLVRPSR
ncbi:transcriptional repressor LexA [Rehaibacterium terrae]|uniref:LexA repressor n=1 Tax=Rehaibacterium terrae TaxID=1341696 RepID=A0A7W7Y0C5_9GAMM|nr:transcriptional repressor LexA [Rehaibacterium terrae]MBB5015747.1 repressor LexA [Rehaibacterium terrae]